MLVKVMNMSGAPHRDRYDGRDYEFPADGTVIIPADAAVHIFGMGLSDRSRQIVRLNWAPTTAQIPEALERLNCFLFEQVKEGDDEELVTEIPSKMEKPTSVPAIDPDLVPLKSRTRNILSKAS